ncbi:MAG: cytochrome-c peroxidase [Crocinitomicaceae bacterium]|nr:cytochrome-c peroxidase [Crocinitomicaceae bacterium]
MKYLLLLFLFIMFFLSCKKDKVNHTPTPYILQIPSHFPEMEIPEDNPMTVEGVKLGRKLFYEKQLSGDNSISCATCHAPSASFSDSNQYSFGVNGTIGNRNSMALINVGWNNFFFWDGRVKTLEEQILIPVEDPIEMHDNWTDVILTLKSDLSYKNMFFEAFQTTDIDSTHAAKAIAQFIRTMISGSSKYDVIYKVENNLPLNSLEQNIYLTVTPDEIAGYDLFKSLNGADCFHCHNGPLMQVQKFSNNGLDLNFADNGRGLITGDPNDNGKFKVPTLRNIEFTAPYMHDGRFSSLDEVIEHYSSGIQISPTIDPLIEFASQGGVQLDAFEKDLIKKFLLTLTDYTFINNPDFQEP